MDYQNCLNYPNKPLSQTEPARIIVNYSFDSAYRGIAMKNAMQLKALLKNHAAKKGVAPQALQQNYTDP